jgi:hypothetical protein
MLVTDCEVLAHIREVDQCFDSKGRQLGRIADPGVQQNGRSVNRASGENDLL